jgi:hypothetical protein
VDTSTSAQQLVAAAVSGDDRAFAALVRRHESHIAAVIRRYVRDADAANDVLQETLIQAWKAMSALRDTDRVPRKLVDAGKWAPTKDGVLELRNADPGEIGSGLFRVTVGEHTEDCLRVIDEYPEGEGQGVLMEAFVACDGQALLCRRYNGVQWQSDQRGGPWDRKLPDNARLSISGTTYVHWYDCVPARALGLSSSGS